MPDQPLGPLDDPAVRTSIALVPSRSATSTSRSELELFDAPITSIASQRPAIALTAACRFEVA